MGALVMIPLTTFNAPVSILDKSNRAKYSILYVSLLTLVISLFLILILQTLQVKSLFISISWWVLGSSLISINSVFWQLRKKWVVYNIVLLYMSIRLPLVWLYSNIVGAAFYKTLHIESLAIIILFLLSSLFLKNHDKPTDLRNFIIKYLRFGRHSLVAHLVGILSLRIDQFLILLLLDDISMGVYFFIVSLVEKLLLFTTAVQPVLAVKMAYNEISVERSNVFSGVIILLTSVVSLIAFPIFVSLSSGHIPVLVLLMLAIIVSSGSRVLALSLSLEDKISINTKISIGMLFLNVLLNFVFIPMLGITGAAVATFISYSLNFILKFRANQVASISIHDYFMNVMLESKDIFKYVKKISI